MRTRALGCLTAPILPPRRPTRLHRLGIYPIRWKCSAPLPVKQFVCFPIIACQLLLVQNSPPPFFCFVSWYLLPFPISAPKYPFSKIPDCSTSEVQIPAASACWPGQYLIKWLSWPWHRSKGARAFSQRGILVPHMVQLMDSSAFFCFFADP